MKAVVHMTVRQCVRRDRVATPPVAFRRVLGIQAFVRGVEGCCAPLEVGHNVEAQSVIQSSFVQ